MPLDGAELYPLLAQLTHARVRSHGTSDHREIERAFQSSQLVSQCLRRHLLSKFRESAFGGFIGGNEVAQFVLEFGEAAFGEPAVVGLGAQLDTSTIMRV